jgi:peroxiredoxin
LTLEHTRFACTTLILATVLAACGPRSAAEVGRGRGSEPVSAPNLSLRALNGETVRLSDYRGQVMVLNFWATWCPPCRAEIPEFAHIYRSYRNRKVVVIGVSVDGEGIERVRSFSEEHDIPYPVVIGDEDATLAFSRLEGIPTVLNGGSDKVVMESGRIEAIPTTFIVDQEGRIYRKHVGYRERTHIEADLQHLLEGGREISGEGS